MTEPSDIYHWRRLDDRITTSGQPSEEQLARIASLGVRHVVNLGLHTHERALPDEAASLARLGVEYVHIPVDFDHPTEDDYARFRDTMTRLEGERVHVHCIANLRVSAFLYRWQREAAGRDDVPARSLMDSVWRPGGAWAAMIGDEAARSLPHRPPEKDGE